jgi:TRAP-type mannitol/chloroaromatic compound transport system substrate-binding protein
LCTKRLISKNPLASLPAKVAAMVKEMSGGNFIIKVEGKEKQ